MSDEPLTWPTDQIDQEVASRWVVSHVGTEVGPPQILQLKSWAVTARFGTVVLKANFKPLFPQVVDVHAVLASAAPASTSPLIASEVVDGGFWTLFDHIPGPTVEAVGTAAALAATGRALAAVQVAVAKQGLTRIPGIAAGALPRLLLEDSQDQPEDLVAWLRGAQDALQADAESLTTIPLSLDQPDLNSGNAILCDDGRVVLLDWEEATVSCPLFSVDRLLDEALELSAVDPVLCAYLEGFPEVAPRQVEAAARLVPLQRAIEARAFARALGWPHPHTHLTARLLKLARERSTWRMGTPLLHFSQIPRAPRPSPT